MSTTQSKPSTSEPSQKWGSNVSQDMNPLSEEEEDTLSDSSDENEQNNVRKQTKTHSTTSTKQNKTSVVSSEDESAESTSEEESSASSEEDVNKKLMEESVSSSNDDDFTHFPEIRKNLKRMENDLTELLSLSFRLTALDPSDPSTLQYAILLRDKLQDASSMITSTDGMIGNTWEQLKKQPKQNQAKLNDLRELGVVYNHGIAKIAHIAGQEKTERKRVGSTAPDGVNDWLFSSKGDVMLLSRHEEHQPASRYVVSNPFTVLKSLCLGLITPDLANDFSQARSSFRRAKVPSQTTNRFPTLTSQKNKKLQSLAFQDVESGRVEKEKSWLAKYAAQLTLLGVLLVVMIAIIVYVAIRRSRS